MGLKNRAAVICPNCGTEMVRTQFEIEDGWISGWLCECDDIPADEQEGEIT